MTYSEKEESVHVVHEMVDLGHSRDSTDTQKETDSTQAESDLHLGFRSLFRYTERSDIPGLVFAIVVCSIAACAVPLQNYIYGKIFEKLSRFYLDRVAYSIFIGQIRYLAGMIMVVGLAQAILRWAGIYAWLMFGEKQANRVRTQLYYQLIRLNSMDWYDEQKLLMGQLAQVNRSIEELREATSGHLGLLTETLTTCIGLFVMAMFQSWTLTLVILATIPVIGVTSWFFGGLTRKAAKDENNFSSICSKILDWNLVNDKTIKMFNAKYIEVVKFNKNVDQSARAFYRESNAISLNGAILKTLSFIMFVQGFWFGNYLIRTGKLSIDQVFTCFGSCLALGVRMNSIAAILAELNRAYAAGEKIAAILQHAPHELTKRRKLLQKFTSLPVVNGIYPIGPCNGAITFREVNFSYPTRPNIRVLENIDLSIKPNIMNFIIGGSGSGKSTIAQLMLQFYKPAEDGGRIEVDGFNLETLSHKWIAENITYLQQTPAIFKDTLIENLTLGGYGWSEPNKIDEACQFALLSDILGKMKDGFSTVISPQLLSGGQKQRIALARAFIRNTEILILDEALCELDLKLRKALFNAIRDWRNGKTTIVITHDLSSIDENDYVITLENGKVSNVPFKVVKELSSESNFNENADKLELHTLTDDIPNISNPAILMDLEKEESAQDLEPLKSTFFILKYCKEYIPNKVLLCFAVIISAIGSVLNPVFSYCFAKLLSYMVLISIGENVMQDLKVWSCIIIGIAIASGLCHYISQFSLLYISEKWIVKLRKEILLRLVEKDVSYFELEKTDATGITTLLMNDTRDLRNLVSEAITLLINLVLMTVVGMVWCLVIGWKLSLVGVAFVPLIVFVTSVYSYTLLIIENKYKSSVVEVESHLHDSVQNMKSIFSLNLVETFVEKYGTKMKILKRNGQVRAFLGGFGEPLSALCISVATGTILFYAMQLTGKGEYTQERSMQVITLLTFTMAMVSSLIDQLPSIVRGRRAGTYIIDFLEQKDSEIEIKGTICPYTKFKTSKKPIIQFNNVSFSYPNRPTHLVLKGIKLDIEAGQSVAITGESGSGKSTIALLLERFQIAKEGTILLKDTEINKLDVEWLRSYIGFVPQVPVFFEGTILENLTYGLDSKSFTGDDITNVLKMVNMYSYVSSLEMGINSSMGEGLTSKFSGGQLQRLSIARAIIRNPKILILDECTSALDPENARIVNELVQNRFYKGRDITILAITHSKELMSSCERVCVLKNGKIVEDGEYSDLMEKEGELFRIVNT